MSEKLLNCPFCGEAPELNGYKDRCRCDCLGEEVSFMPVEWWNTRPVPELPEGYTEEETEDEDWHWFDLLHEGHLVASVFVDSGELHTLDVGKQHFPALAIWLQRRKP